MDLCDVAVVGGGPAGSCCAAFCAAAGLRVILLERERFPREKVCGDCLNPSCGPVLQRLQLTNRVRSSPHSELQIVEFISIGGHSVSVDLPSGEKNEIAIKRSLFDELLLARARELGCEVRDATTVTAIHKASTPGWRITAGETTLETRILIGADGRNSTVARLCNLLPRPQRERIALQSHIPLPADFGKRVVLQFLKEGYSGQAPVSENELNVCLVAKPSHIEAVKEWARNRFSLSHDHPWRSTTPLTRRFLPPAHQNLFLIGDAARVVEPFTGEGIYYALRSGELAANVAIKSIFEPNPEAMVREFERNHAAIYRGWLWINQLARAAVLSPRVASQLLRLAHLEPALLQLLTSRVTSSRAKTRST
jgi:geranylgeranyl reductase family protein